jgi:hypothetical protein
MNKMFYYRWIHNINFEQLFDIIIGYNLINKKIP